MTDPVKTVNALGARWAANFDTYTEGRITASEVVCALYDIAPCTCHPID